MDPIDHEKILRFNYLMRDSTVSVHHLFQTRMDFVNSMRTMPSTSGRQDFSTNNRLLCNLSGLFIARIFGPSIFIPSIFISSIASISIQSIFVTLIQNVSAQEKFIHQIIVPDEFIFNFILKEISYRIMWESLLI